MEDNRKITIKRIIIRNDYELSVNETNIFHLKLADRILNICVNGTGKYEITEHVFSKDKNETLCYVERDASDDGFTIEKRDWESDNLLYWQSPDGKWGKYEYDVDGKLIYEEDNKGVIFDNREPDLEME